MDALIIEEKKGANYILLEISGVINSYTFTEFRSKVYTYIMQSNLVLDMSAVTGIDSSGLGVLMGAFNDGEESGNTLYLMRPSTATYEALDSTGFTDTFNIIHAVTEVV